MAADTPLDADRTIPIIGQEDAPRGQHIMNALQGNPGGMPDLGDALEIVAKGREFGQSIRDALSVPLEDWEVTPEFRDAFAEVERYMQGQYPEAGIAIEVGGEAYVGCVIMHYRAEANGYRFHTERVVSIGSKLRDPEAVNRYGAVEDEMLQFLMLALGAPPAEVGGPNGA